MGDRVSIEFQLGDDRSVVLFSHWGGMGFVRIAEDYAKRLEKAKRGKHIMPLDRLEPSVVMIDFLRVITKDMDEVESGYYLGIDGNDGDNSDNGHHIILLKKDE